MMQYRPETKRMGLPYIPPVLMSSVTLSKGKTTWSGNTKTGRNSSIGSPSTRQDVSAGTLDGEVGILGREGYTSGPVPVRYSQKQS